MYVLKAGVFVGTKMNDGLLNHTYDQAESECILYISHNPLSHAWMIVRWQVYSVLMGSVLTSVSDIIFILYVLASWIGMLCSSNASNVLSHMFPVVSHVARHCSFLPYFLFILPANSFASASVFSYAISSSIFPLSSITHTTHFFLLMSIPIFLILFITSLQIVSDGSEAAITYQCARHRNAVARIAPFKIKCAKHMFPKGSIHHLAYDEDVFTCIQK